MGGFVGPGDLAVLLLVALLIFGPDKLPEIAKSLGNGIRELRESVNLRDGDTTDTKPSQRDSLL